MKLIRSDWLLALSVSTGLALAQGDYYVDASIGVDQPSAGTPSAPWKTITYAMSQVSPDAWSGPPDTIHVAPGTYDAALGEVFPIVGKGMVKLVGDAGSASTAIDGGGIGTLISMNSSISGLGTPFPPETEVRGFELRNAQYGITLSSSWNPVEPTLVDLEIHDMSVAGIWSSSNGVNAGGTNPSLARVRIDGCGVGLYFAASGALPDGYTLEDCAVTNSAFGGLVFNGGSAAQIVLRRTRIEASGGDAVSALFYNYGGLDLVAEDCLIAHNGGDGYDGGINCGLAVHANATFRRCTVAYNGGVGVRSLPSAPVDQGCLLYDSTTLEGCILYGNGDDLLEHPGYASLSMSYCDVGDGDLAGQSGNVSADPLFVSSTTGDFRLRWGSPCAEAGDPATPGSTLDLHGTPRPVDGDLDALERADIGAYELASLYAPLPARVGQPYAIEFWGPQGGLALLYWAAGPLLAAPIQTAFGQLDLSPFGLLSLGAHTTGSATPGSLVLLVPSDSALIGAQLGFQAGVLPASGGLPFAASNPLGVVIQG